MFLLESSCATEFIAGQLVCVLKEFDVIWFCYCMILNVCCDNWDQLWCKTSFVVCTEFEYCKWLFLSCKCSYFIVFVPELSLDFAKFLLGGQLHVRTIFSHVSLYVPLMLFGLVFVWFHNILVSD